MQRIAVYTVIGLFAALVAGFGAGVIHEDYVGPLLDFKVSQAGIVIDGYR